MTIVADEVVVVAARALRGRPALPGDKSISHRALLLALLAEGESTLTGASGGADVRSTAAIVAALGAMVAAAEDGDGRIAYRIVSPGIDGLTAPSAELDCGNSGTSLRLVAGILAGQPFTAVLDGDASLRGRPVARIIKPLRSMGATLAGRRQDTLPPVTVTGRRTLRSIDWTTDVPSAQVKSAILLAGLRAGGTTMVHESVATRDHTERLLRVRGVEVRTIADPDGGCSIEIDGGQLVATHREVVPADPSAAAFWLVAGAIHPAAELTVTAVDVNPTRRVAIDLLQAMGAKIDERPGAGAGAGADGEPIADLTVRSVELRAIDVSPADSARAIDELPILCLAATQARGRTTIRGAGELRVKESDRLAGIAEGLAALGANVTIQDDDIAIVGPTPLRGAAVDAQDDHRLAMTFAIAGLVASGRTTIHGARSAAISDPRFFTELERIRS
jgi:3-phosphoshikimate 1-carboxyvinyltransferase